jgi:hypothetical protein
VQLVSAVPEATQGGPSAMGLLVHASATGTAMIHGRVRIRFSSRGSQ